MIKKKSEQSFYSKLSSSNLPHEKTKFVTETPFDPHVSFTSGFLVFELNMSGVAENIPTALCDDTAGELCSDGVFASIHCCACV